jgi:hypothetical protein
VIVDNSALVAPFAPERDDGDSFIYTELLDRSKRKGNNGFRVLRTFFHRSREEFAEQWPVIRQLCDVNNVRACTRLAPRSFKRVGCEFTKLVVEASLTGNWAGMKTLYARACGIAASGRIWLFDFDAVDSMSDALRSVLTVAGKVRAVIPSRRAYHLITEPFAPAMLNLSGWPKDGRVLPKVQLHKDNPTNLYIPEGAA